MNINITFGTTRPEVAELIQLVKLLGEKMATVAEVIEAVKSEQSLIAGAVQTIHSLVDEGLKLLQAGQTEELEALLNEIKGNSDALVAATLEGTDAAALIDAANG